MVYFKKGKRIIMHINEKLIYDPTSLYNLGYFDTVDTSNAGYDLITRKTGYIFLKDLEFITDGTYFQTTKSSSQEKLNVLPQIASNVVASLVCACYTTRSIEYIQNNTDYDMSIGYYYESDSNHKCNYLRIKNLTYQGNLSNFLSQIQGLIVQYELATSYTEKVIKNRPLNTLDQKGSQWVRNEWEKTLNLFGGTISTNRGSFSNGTFSSNKDSNTLSHLYIYLRVNGSNSTLLQKTTSGSFSISFSKTSDTTAIIPYDAGNYSDSYCSLDISGLPNGTYILSGYFDNSNVNKSVISNLMLNEGSTALPYQPYYGPVMHGKLYQHNIAVYLENPYSRFSITVITEQSSKITTLAELKGLLRNLLEKGTDAGYYWTQLSGSFYGKNDWQSPTKYGIAIAYQLLYIKSSNSITLRGNIVSYNEFGWLDESGFVTTPTFDDNVCELA